MTEVSTLGSSSASASQNYSTDDVDTLVAYAHRAYSRQARFAWCGYCTVWHLHPDSDMNRLIPPEDVKCFKGVQSPYKKHGYRLHDSGGALVALTSGVGVPGAPPDVMSEDEKAHEITEDPHDIDESEIPRGMRQMLTYARKQGCEVRRVMHSDGEHEVHVAGVTCGGERIVVCYLDGKFAHAFSSVVAGKLKSTQARERMRNERAR